MTNIQGKISTEQVEELLKTLKVRFEKNKNRHRDLEWEMIEERLEALPLKVRNSKLWSLSQMENTGGEPDVADRDTTTGEIVFYDFAAESPKGRRSLCYDREALNSRKQHKPANSVLDLAAEMGIELIGEEDYRKLQETGDFDTKTSSWIATPPSIRKLGGALFADFRYGQVFVYHNGAQSYYSSRGFRGMLRV